MLKKALFLTTVALAPLSMAYTISPLVATSSHYQYKADTSTARANRYFNQGLQQFWDHQYSEAVRSFQAAIDIDYNCGHCYHMLALSFGSISNGPLSGNERAFAIDAIQQGLQRPVISAKARALLHALSNRYYLGEKQDRKAYQLGPAHLTTLNERESYMEAMRDLAKQYPKDIEIQALFAHSLYDIHRDQFWSANFAPIQYTTELGQLLDKIVSTKPLHPGAATMYVNYLAQSANPDEAIQTAQSFLGNFVEMTSPLQYAAKAELRLGKLHEAYELIEQAIASYNREKNIAKNQGFPMTASYRLQSLLYDQWHLALLEGRSEQSKHIANRLKTLTSYDHLDTSPELQIYFTLEYLNTLYFQDWKQALNFKEPTLDLPLIKGMWYLSAGMAFIANEKIDSAKITKQNLDGLIDDYKQSKLFDGQLANQLNLASQILDAKLIAQTGNLELAAEKWQLALQTLAALPAYAQPLYELYVQLNYAQALAHIKDYRKATKDATSEIT